MINYCTRQVLNYLVVTKRKQTHTHHMDICSCYYVWAENCIFADIVPHTFYSLYNIAFQMDSRVGSTFAVIVVIKSHTKSCNIHTTNYHLRT